MYCILLFVCILNYIIVIVQYFHILSLQLHLLSIRILQTSPNLCNPLNPPKYSNQ